MRRSEFDRAVAEEFGRTPGRVLLRDLSIDALGDRTAEQALAAGVKAGVVWQALCAAMDVPEARRHGRGLVDPQQDTRHAAS